MACCGDTTTGDQMPNICRPAAVHMQLLFRDFIVVVIILAWHLKVCQ